MLIWKLLKFYLKYTFIKDDLETLDFIYLSSVTEMGKQQYVNT